MSLRTEVIAGATTFFPMSYILAVNPANLLSTGMDKGTLFTATALAAALATLLLAFMAKLNLGDISDAFPAFITMITMVLCYSIADGICLGILSYVIMKLCTGHRQQLNLTLYVLAVLFVINFIFG